MDVVVAALADADCYGQWWPQIRRVHRLSGDEGLVWVRSVLPVTLLLRLRRIDRADDSGVLRVAIDGDLRGWARWVVAADPDEAHSVVADFRQEVEVASLPLRVLAAVARPVLIGNHAWMMWSGQRGLRRRLQAP